ncbi:MAG: acetylxylan esterase [Kiritimatiellae bacterium]|nr:acetylxylan esterase [Kiritimatiellia bacterium]
MKALRLLPAFLLLAEPAAAEPDWDGAMLSGRIAGHDGPFFAPGEEMVFEIVLEGAKGDIEPGAYFVDWERRGDDGVVEKGRAPLPAADAPLVVRTKSDKPGFVCVEANVVTPDGRRVPKNHRWEKRVFFEGGAAVAPETLRAAAEPADYDAFWESQMARLAEVPVRAELAPAPCADSAVRLYSVRIDCAGGRPVTGWMTVPADASATNRYPAEISYRGASRNDQAAPDSGPHDRIRFESNGHGFDLGKGQEYVTAFFDSIRKPGTEYGFDPESNSSRETSYWLGMALRAVRALQWVATLPEWDGKSLTLAAGSQGGWQAFMAASRVPAATRISTSVTWGCDWTGQAELGRLPATYRPKCWFPDMAYFDAVFAARRVKCPVEISKAGLGDYVSPPSSLAVLYNELRVPKKITWYQGWTHGWQPAGMASWTIDGGYDATVSAAAAPVAHDDGALAAP